jgi:hypothetical protein
MLELKNLPKMAQPEVVDPAARRTTREFGYGWVP